MILPAQEGWLMPTPSQLSFCDLATRYEALRHNGDPLEALAAHVPGAEFRPALKRFSAAPNANKAGAPQDWAKESPV